MPAPRALQTDHDNRDDLHDEVDNHAHLPPPQFVAGEAAVRLATMAAIAIAEPVADRLPMLFEGLQDGRWNCGQGDKTNGLF